MKLETNLKIQVIYRWGIVLLCLVGGFVMTNEGIVDYKIQKFTESAKEVPLSSVLKNKPDDKWIKISDYEIDIQKRLRALPDKGSTNNLHILVPLRIPGERSDAPIRCLYRMPEDSEDPISMAYSSYQDSGILVLNGNALFAEIVPIEELSGNVPNVIRKNDRVAKNVLVLFNLPVRNDIEANFIAAGIFFAIAFFVYWRIRRDKKQAKPKFY